MLLSLFCSGSDFRRVTYQVFSSMTTTSTTGSMESVLASSTDNPVVVWIWQALTGPLESLLVATGRVLVGQGIPTIPKTLLQNIHRWEYVDLANLLPASSSHDSASASSPLPSTRYYLLFLGCKLVHPRKHQITSIAEWVQAFTVYTAAFVSKHPSATLEMLAYMLTIINPSQQYDGLHWRSYDANYGITVAASGNKTWSRLDTNLYTRFFTGKVKPITAICDSLANATHDCPRYSRPGYTNTKREPRRSTAPPAKRCQWPSDICTEFNAKGACSFGAKCKFYIYAECSGDHAARACSAKTAKEIAPLSNSPPG